MGSWVGRGATWMQLQNIYICMQHVINENRKEKYDALMMNATVCMKLCWTLGALRQTINFIWPKAYHVGSDCLCHILVLERPQERAEPSTRVKPKSPFSQDYIFFSNSQKIISFWLRMYTVAMGRHQFFAVSICHQNCTEMTRNLCNRPNSVFWLKIWRGFKVDMSQFSDSNLNKLYHESVSQQRS